MPLASVLRGVFASLAALLLAAPAVRAADPALAPPTVADFFRPAKMLKPMLSPSGRYLAAAVSGDDGRIRLAVLDLENLQDSRIVANYSDADVQRYWWLNDKRLAYTITDLQAGSGEWTPPGLWAVDRDGSDARKLIKAHFQFISDKSSLIVDRSLPWHWRFHSSLNDGSDDVLVQNHHFGLDDNVDDTSLSRLNTRTGLMRSLSGSVASHVKNWWVDAQGQPVASEGWHQGRYTSHWRNAQGTWGVWQQGSTYDSALPRFHSFLRDGTVLALASSTSGTRALYRVDTASRQLEPEPLVSLKGYDFDGELVVDMDSGALVGVHFETDAQGSAWLDPTLRTAQAEVDALVPGMVNRLDCRRCLAASVLLVSSHSDTQPPVYSVYRRDSKSLSVVARSRPWINARQMGQRDMFSIKARDGMSLPLLLTRPAGKAAAPRPAVVLVHGGPYVRGAHWAWEPQAQFLASRGYVVIEPEFRGSTGYGHPHFRAGWKQWGLAMQDDVADAVEWAVKQGWVDPKRVCIAGASYGGYATLMGLIKHHDLYQCGFEWVGVSDIELMYTINWSDSSDEWKRFGMPVLVGDRLRDAEQLRATSPLQQAQRLRRPLLIAHGGSDRRVPIQHGTDFFDAVKKTNPQVEWLGYPDEGHGWRKLETHIDFWTRVERFLDKHIGPGKRD
ncbi:MAG: S9 family peptidase [Burkholderiaceae bacterium]|nr:S9 family peptidase [Burkholderiaceae bacterium]